MPIGKPFDHHQPGIHIQVVGCLGFHGVTHHAGILLAIGVGAIATHIQVAVLQEFWMKGYVVDAVLGFQQFLGQFHLGFCLEPYDAARLVGFLLHAGQQKVCSGLKDHAYRLLKG